MANLQYLQNSFFLLVIVLVALLPACGGPTSPFRVGELPPLTVDSDLQALHRNDPRIPMPSSPDVDNIDSLREDRLYAPRPYLVTSGENSAGLAQANASAAAQADQPGIALTLVDTVLLGLRQNKSIRSAYLNRVVQRFSLYVAEEEFVPRWQTITGSAIIDGGQGSESESASLGTDLTWSTPFGTRFGLAWTTEQIDSNASDTDSEATSSVDLTLNQPLLRGAGRAVNTAGLRLARLTEQQDKLGLRSTVMETVSSLITAYFNYVRQQRNLEITRRNLERSRQLLTSNERLVAAGRMAANDVIQTRLSVSNGELALKEAEGALDTARLVLLNLLSLSPSLQLETNVELEPLRLAVDLDRAKAVAYQNNPAYLSVRLNIEVAQTGLLLAKDNLRWQLDLTGGYNVTGSGRRAGQAIDDIGSESGLWNVGLSLSVPLDMLDLKAAAVRAEVALEQAKLSEEQFREDLDASVRDAVRNVENSWQRLLISKRSVELAQSTLHAEIKKLNVGRSTNFEVLALQLTLREAEIAELNSVIEYLLTLVALDQILGTTLDTWQITLHDN